MVRSIFNSTLLTRKPILCTERSILFRTHTMYRVGVLICLISLNVYLCASPAAAIAGRVKAAIELLRCGADLKAINQYGETAMDLALKHKQVAVQNFLEPSKAKASVELEPQYAIDERNLVWAQRKRRKAVRFDLCTISRAQQYIP